MCEILFCFYIDVLKPFLRQIQNWILDLSKHCLITLLRFILYMVILNDLLVFILFVLLCYKFICFMCLFDFDQSVTRNRKGGKCAKTNILTFSR